jgi:predicted DNA-binding antitoxin AbrB/MazE fold protein
MSLTIEATYENGVFVPVQPLDLADHERVRLTVEPIAVSSSALETIRRRRGNRIQIDPQLAQEIALSPEFLPEES